MSLAYDIAVALSPNGKPEKNKDGWVCCCPVHSDKKPSMSIVDDGKGGVICHCQVGCDWKDIKKALVDRGLLPEWKPGKNDNWRPKQSATTNQTQSREAKQEEKESFPWSKARRDPLPISAYLKSRAINTVPIPPCLKWGQYKDRETGEDISMIVCAVSKQDDDKVCAVQRLFIDTEENKKTGAKMLGNCEGRGVWFDRKGDVSELMIGEGVETVLSAVQATGKNGIAALSTSGMKSLIIPDETKKIFILVDSDPVREKEAASMPGQKAAVELAKRFIAGREDRQAYLVSPDDSCFTEAPEKLDFNDLLKDDKSGESIRRRFAAAVEVRGLGWVPKDEESESGGDDDGYYPERTLKALHKMNKNHAGVLLGTKFRVLKESFSEIDKRFDLTFIEPTSFNLYFANRKYPVRVGDEVRYQSISKIWMEWEERRMYDAVVFSPGNSVAETDYNLWRGWAVTPKKGDWSLMQDHIFNVICGGDADNFTYLLAWMARIIQSPGGKRPGVAVVLTGGKGTGKGIFVNYFGKLFGGSFMPISSSDGFTGSFNMHLAKASLVFLDEAIWGGDKQHEGRLKAMITEDTMLFQPKGIDSMPLANHMNIMMASNENWVVPAGVDERRFFVLKVLPDRAGDFDYFRAISQQMDNGGCEAMMWDLMHLDFSGVELRSAPKTEGLAEQVEETLDDVLMFWRHVLSRGFLLSDKDTGEPRFSEADERIEKSEWPEKVYKYEVYFEFTNIWGRGKRHLRSEDGFWRRTYSFWGGTYKNFRKGGRSERRVYGITLDPLMEIRKAFSEFTKIKFDDSDEISFHEMQNGDLPFEDQF